jgi:hypothetical protein
LRPTWSLKLASPFGSRAVADISRIFGVSIAWAAKTTIRAVSEPSERSGRRKWTVVIRPSESASRRKTTEFSLSSAPAAWASSTWTVASYLAPIGHIGMQKALPQHCGRPLNPSAALTRACGVAVTFRPSWSAAAANCWSP